MEQESEGSARAKAAKASANTIAPKDVSQDFVDDCLECLKWNTGAGRRISQESADGLRRGIDGMVRDEVVVRRRDQAAHLLVGMAVLVNKSPEGEALKNDLEPLRKRFDELTKPQINPNISGS